MHSSLKGAGCQGRSKATHLKVGGESGGRRPSRAEQAKGPCLLDLLRGATFLSGGAGGSHPVAEKPRTTCLQGEGEL